MVAFEIKSKCGVSPFITQPSAINPLYFLILFKIRKGISNVPGAYIILYPIIFSLYLSSSNVAPWSKSFAKSS